MFCWERCYRSVSRWGAASQELSILRGPVCGLSNRLPMLTGRCVPLPGRSSTLAAGVVPGRASAAVRALRCLVTR